MAKTLVAGDWGLIPGQGTRFHMLQLLIDSSCCQINRFFKTTTFFSFPFLYIIYLFFVVLSSLLSELFFTCSKLGLLFVGVHGFLTAVASRFGAPGSTVVARDTAGNQHPPVLFTHDALLFIYCVHENLD